MAKFLIFKKLEDGSYGAKLGSYEGPKDDSSANRSYLMAEPMASHFELGEGQDEDVVVPVWVEEQIIPAVGLPEEEGYVPEQVIAAHWALQDDPTLVATKAAQAKANLITEKYNQMNADVYNQMTAVFGTSKPDSATAYKETWTLMVSDPSDWSGLGLKDDEGNVLDTDQKVQDYAAAKLLAVVEYGKYRMQRIAAFKAEKEAILNG
jgi:hypothetical protein